MRCPSLSFEETRFEPKYSAAALSEWERKDAFSRTAAAAVKKKAQSVACSLHPFFPSLPWSREDDNCSHNPESGRCPGTDVNERFICFTSNNEGRSSSVKASLLLARPAVAMGSC